MSALDVMPGAACGFDSSKAVPPPTPSEQLLCGHRLKWISLNGDPIFIFTTTSLVIPQLFLPLHHWLYLSCFYHYITGYTSTVFTTTSLVIPQLFLPLHHWLYLSCFYHYITGHTSTVFTTTSLVISQLQNSHKKS
jgi:hypothetical protein